MGRARTDVPSAAAPRSTRATVGGCYPPYQTCHCRFQAWNAAAVSIGSCNASRKISAIAAKSDLSEAFVDATFASAKKGALASASPYEPHLVPATLDARFLPELPARLIGDRGYDSDPLDLLLCDRYGVEMIAAADGKSNGSWPDSTTPGAPSCAGNTTSGTSSGCCSSPAPASCSGIYEMPSSTARH